MAAWRRSSSGSSFTVPHTGTVKASELSQPPLYASIHTSSCVCPRQKSAAELALPVPGEVPSRRCQPLCACFLTRCKFFLFKTLTFSQPSVSSSSFVRQAYAVCGSGTKRGHRREPKWLRTYSTLGVSLELGQAWERREGSEAHGKPGTASFFR